jgi:hypothetical protein
MSAPKVFRGLSFDDGLSAARDQGKLLLVSVSCQDCHACRQMDETTWQSDELRAWVDEHVIAIRVDAAQPLPVPVKSAPTIVALREGTEIDRVSGARGASELLQWLGGLNSGDTELDRLRRAPDEDLRARLQLARTLVERGLDDEALDRFVWLWQNSLKVSPSWVGVRSSYLIAALKPLITRSRIARDRFVVLRNDVEARLADRQAFRDWLTLNDLLDEDARFLPWMDRLDETTANDLEAVRNHRFLGLIEKFDRWTDLARVIKDPVRVLRSEHELGASVTGNAPDWASADELAAARSHFAASLRKKAAVLHRAMRAAGRDADASAVVSEAKRLDPSAEMTEALADASLDET